MPGSIPANIRLLALDVDGVLTDGGIYVNDQGYESKRFNVRDGLGIKAWQCVGHQVAILSARNVPCVNHRAQQLDIDHVVQGSRDKAQGLKSLCEKLNIPLEETCFIGDDWIDIPALAIAGFPVAVPRACHTVQAAARYVTAAQGGDGAIRETVELLLNAQGLLDRARAHFSGPR